MAPKPISEPSASNPSGGSGCLILFGAIFASAGGFFLYLMFISPWLQSRAAQDWPAATCKITNARIESHQDDDGTSYSAEFEYDYTVDAVEYQGDRFSFANFSGSRGRAQSLLKKYPIGSQQTCHYNPADPTDVVLDRDNSNLQTWFVFLPVIFILIGGAIMLGGLFGLFKRGNSVSGSVDASEATLPAASIAAGIKASEAGWGIQTEADRLDEEWAAPRKLKTTSSRMVAFIGIGIAAIFWNGILSFMFFNAIGDLFKDGFEFGNILMGLFFVPFFLVGIALIGFTLYYFLSLFNPTVEVAITTGAVPIGGEVDLAWEIEGKSERIKKLTIEIHGVQSVRYVRGTDTVTETNIFELITVASLDDPKDIPFGSATITIPTDTMHTFEADNNKILWSVNVHGDIPWGPDVFESFSFRVTPNIGLIPDEKKAI
ncbi:MAG: DUF3592 domain-containing protein [Planctomycetota bacterium]